MFGIGEVILAYLLSPIAIGVLILLGILFEHNEARGFAIFTTLVTAVVSVLYFQVPLMTVLYAVIAYIVVGVLWSFFRYKRHASNIVEMAVKVSSADASQMLRKLHPSTMIGSITAWIIVWPFSMIENLIGDIINTVELLVKKVFKGVYNKIYDNAVNQVAQAVNEQLRKEQAARDRNGA